MAARDHHPAEHEPSTLIGPDQLTGDMSANDICFVLGHIRFRNGLHTIAIDKDVRKFLLDAVLARIGGHTR